MRSEWRKHLDADVPRYTSYPSALRMSDAFDVPAYEAALEAVGQYEALSVYVHMPFCRELCWYCGCNMRVENKAERIARYVDAVVEEIRQVGARLGGRGYVTQVHFGGGTPNHGPVANIERILHAVEDHIGLRDDTPVAIEIDPRCHTTLQAAQLSKAGVTRFSLGVQDFDPSVQKAIHRIQSAEMVDRCMQDLRRAGCRDISVDILYGLPAQTLCSFVRTIERVIALAPERVSLFGYTHLPDRFPHQRLIPEDALPGRWARANLCETAGALFAKAGYERIGFDHFSLPGTPIAQAARRGRLNRNFQGFTEDPSDTVLGVGASAISGVHGRLLQNHKDSRDYIGALEGGTLPVARGLCASDGEQELGRWIRRFLCDLRGSLVDYAEAAGAAGTVPAEIRATLRSFAEDGIVRLEGSEVVLEEEARTLARRVAAVFDPEMEGRRAYPSPAV